MRRPPPSSIKCTYNDGQLEQDRNQLNRLQEHPSSKGRFRIAHHSTTLTFPAVFSGLKPQKSPEGEEEAQVTQAATVAHCPLRPRQRWRDLTKEEEEEQGKTKQLRARPQRVGQKRNKISNP